MTGPRQRIVIHAGFHKTGTSTAQAVLRRNRVTLRAETAMILPFGLKSVRSAARGFSTWRDDMVLARAGIRLGSLVRDLGVKPARKLLVTSEELSGHMPGRDKLADYSAAPALMRAYAEALHQLFGARLHLTFVFSLREAEAWLKSAYGEHVRSSRMLLDFDSFRDRYAAAADMPATVDAVRDAVAPHAVVETWLEDAAARPLGPADPLLDTIGITAASRAVLESVPPANTAPADAVLDELLAINRSPRSDAEVRAAKHAVLAALPNPRQTR